MRIVCEKCQATYHIPDEKIVRKTVRMTCRKCGEVITMRVDEETSGNSTLGKWRASALNTPKKTQSETPSWYYSYNGESFGPYTQDELIAKIQSPSVNPVAKDCYVWTKSLGSWKPLVEVEPFASAAQPSVVPVPAAPVKKPTSSVTSTAVKKSSPDISSLKMKLLGGKTVQSELRDQLEDRLDSRTETLTNSTPLNDAAPTHQAMPALDALVSNEASGANTVSRKVELFEDEKEEGRVKGGSPLLSFQSLDVISDVRREDGSGKQERVAKPFPSLSTIKPISKTAEPASKAIPAFKPATSAAPGISSLFGSKPAASGTGLKSSGLKPFSLGGLSAKSGGGMKPASSTENAGVKGGSLFGGKSSSPLPSLGSPLIKPASETAAAVKKPSSSLNKSVSGEANEFMLDHKEDLGDVLNSSEKNAAVASSDRQDSISDWIPSQMDLRLDSKMDGISLDSFSSPKVEKVPSTASQNALKQNSQSISDVFKREFGGEESLADIDLDDDEDISISPEDSAIEQSLNGGGDELAAIDLDEAESSSVASMESVDRFTKEEAHEAEGDDEDMNVVSAIPLAQLLTGKAVQTKAASSESEVQNEGELEIGAIDLDSDDASILPAAFMSQAGDELAAKDGVREGSAEEPVQAVARRSSKLDDIMKRQAELAAASEEIDKIDYTNIDNSDGPSEASMMIELSVLRDIEKKDSKSRNVKKIAAIAIIAVVFVGLAVFVTMLANKKVTDEKEENIASFGSAEGRAIDSDQLRNEVADVGEIEIVGGSDQEKKHHHSSGSSRKEESVQEETPVVEEPAVAQVVAPTTPQIRADGRRSADLGPAVQDNSALEAVTGSKYQGVAKSAADAPDRMNAGWKTVSRTVVACQKRLAKSGSLQVDKFYVNLKIKADGSVDDFTITAAGNVDELVKCLESKKSTWDFGPGDATADRKVFVN